MISRVFNKLKRKGEVIVLQRKEATLRDAIGNQKYSWVNVQTLNGVIREKIERNIDNEGDRDASASPLSSIKTTGYFLPFDIDNTQEYRIKRSLPGSSPIYYKVYHIFPDLVRRNRREFTKVVLRRKDM